MGDIRKAIEKQNAKFREYAQKGDAAGVASLYTGDTCVMPPNSEMLISQEGSKMLFQGFVTGGLKDIKLTTQEVVGFGDMAVERGEYWLKMEPPGSGTVEDEGKYIVLWKKTDEGWKLHWDIFNSNLPAPS